VGPTSDEGLLPGVDSRRFKGVGIEGAVSTTPGLLSIARSLERATTRRAGALPTQLLAVASHGEKSRPHAATRADTVLQRVMRPR
jgi:hypothetical protein